MKPTLDLAEIRGYLAAMVDGEGTVLFRMDRRCVRQVTISNTDADIIAHIRYCLETLGIGYWTSMRYPRGKKPLTTFGISTYDGLRKLVELPLQSGKLDKISEMLTTYTKAVA